MLTSKLMMVNREFKQETDTCKQIESKDTTLKTRASKRIQKIESRIQTK